MNPEKISNNLETKNREVEQEAEAKNEYDQEVSASEIENFREEIVEKIEAKAEELGISKEKLIDLAGLDLESLEAEKLKELNLRRGEFDFIKDSIDQAINEFQKSEKSNAVLKDAPSIVDKIRKFAEKHKKVVSIGQLTLYLSSYGAPALSALADNDVQVEIYGEKISLKDLADNPELIKEIDQARNAGTPIDILKTYFPQKGFEHNGTTFSFNTFTKVNDDNSVEKFIYFGSIGGNIRGIEKLNNNLEEIGVPLLSAQEGKSGYLLDNPREGCPLDIFLKNKEQVVKDISQDLNIPKDKVEKYIESLIMPDVSNISVVELNNFDINENLEIPENALKLQQKKEEVYEKNNVNSEDGIRNPENWLKAEKELEQWGKENGYESFDKAIQEEKENYENLPIAKLENFKFQKKQW